VEDEKESELKADKLRQNGGALFEAGKSSGDQDSLPDPENILDPCLDPGAL